MSSRSSSIVSILGLVMSIVTNLVNRVVALGGSEEMVRRLANPDNPLVQRIAEMIVRSAGKGGTNAPFKNWPAICAALRNRNEDSKDEAVVWANTLANPRSKLGRRMSVAFPEFWSETKVQGPVPWSLLLEIGEKNGQKNESEYGKRMLVTFYATQDYGLPYQDLLIPPLSSYMRQSPKPLIPDHIPNDVEVGSEVEWRGGRWIVVENRFGFGDDNISIVPAECIAMDL